MLKTISQKRFLRGLVASFSSLTQPPASLPRILNLLLTKRGGLRTCDGTQIISTRNGNIYPVSANAGPLLEIFLYEPIGRNNSYYAIYKDYTAHIGPPTNLVAADGGAGGNLSALTYTWVITALDGAGGETIASVQSNNLTLAAGHKANLIWTPPFKAPGGNGLAAGGYNVYRGSHPVVIFKKVNATPIDSSATSYTDNTADLNQLPVFPPSADTTQICTMVQVPAGSYSDSMNVVKVFPADGFQSKDGTPGSFGGGGGFNPNSGNAPPTPAGGVGGNISPLPQIIQFANLMILALGNGFPIYTSDGTPGNTIAITNTFTAQYPAYSNNIGVNEGDQIQATVGGTAYIFQCVQGGITGMTGTPAWVSVLNKTVLDTSGSKVIWKNIGSVTTSPAPRGAAHLEYYAGSLWAANTSPDITADQLDGPSALRMSDANNPNSWNPLNAAQIAKDDGQQITGIKAFTVADAGIAPTAFLTVFKDFSTYQVQGVFGATDFSITQAQTDMGCVSSRSIAFIPGYGIFRMTHLGFANFDGLRDRLISEEIRPYIFGGEDDISPVDWNYIWFAKACQVANPPMYACAVPTTQSNFLPLPGVSVTQGSFVGTTIPPGTYYVKVAKYRSDGTVYLSDEFGPIVIDANHCFSVTQPTPKGGDLSYGLFYGTASGAENFVIPFPADGQPRLLTTPGMAGTPTSGGGMLTRILCYDLVLKAWTIVDLPFPISVMKQVRSIGTIPITVMGGFYDSVIRRWQAGDAQWDAGATVNGAADLDVHWSLTTPRVYAEGASQRIFYRRIVMRGSGSTASLQLTPSYDGSSDDAILAVLGQFLGDEFDARFDLLRSCEDFSAQITGQGVVEIQSLDHQVEPKPAGAFARVIG